MLSDKSLTVKYFSAENSPISGYEFFVTSVYSSLYHCIYCTRYT